MASFYVFLNFCHYAYVAPLRLCLDTCVKTEKSEESAVASFRLCLLVLASIHSVVRSVAYYFAKTQKMAENRQERHFYERCVCFENETNVFLKP